MRSSGWPSLALFCLLTSSFACGATPVSRNVRGTAFLSRSAPRSPELAVTTIPSGACSPHTSHHVRPGTRIGSSAVLAEEDGHSILYAASSDERAVYALDPSTLELLAVTPLDGEPAELLALTDGRILVTLRDKNRLAAFEPRSAREPLDLRCTVPTYVEPYGLAVSPDGARIAVTAGFGHRVTLLDAGSLAPTRTESVPAEPRGVLFSEDGDSIYVSYAVGGVVSHLSLTHADQGVTISYVRSPKGEDAPGASNGSDVAKLTADQFFAMLKRPPEKFDPQANLAAAQGFALTELSTGETDGHRWPARVFVPMTSSDPALVKTPVTYGSNPNDPDPAVVGAFVAVIDPHDRKPISTGLARPRKRFAEDCVLPRGIATWKESLVVACLGSDKLEVLDARGADPISLLTAAYPIAPGASGVAIDDATGRAFVVSSWNAGITVVDLTNDAAAPRFVPLPRRAERPLSPEAERGRELFHATRDTRLSSDGRACASCHPDGRADGLTWSTPDGPRQTIPLAGRIQDSTAFGWFGDHPTLETHIQFTVSRLSGTGLREESDQADLAALAAYVRTLRLPSRDDALDDGADAALEARGRELFASDAVGCAGCHPAGRSDNKRHDVGSGNANEASVRFETPSLVGIGKTAPYFHDGRYDTLLELVSDRKSKMGHSADLSIDDRRALVAYLETL